ncbi:hypothetical protein OH491_21595 [Termitidicoccus mucosus]|uniref:Nucleotide-diphospho-sugar transferase domain-containing protein n=1 Tax=Termitidicoccus mucosus TaxID=1184151 RepID=A0A178IC57_9BACT|nr:hypothetical protein AW736_22125 [Opitutaceae bacterium TSB47]
MPTVIYQSFRTDGVPPWIAACMDSVRRWAGQKGYDYRFYDDTFFDRVPDDIRPQASAHKCVLSDYARLAVARELLGEGYDRAIWIDADALVFDPVRFDLAQTTGYAFCREIWIHSVVFGRPQFKLTVNNSVSLFCRDQRLIDFYLDCAHRTLLRSPSPGPLVIGTDFLEGLRRVVDFPLITNVGILGPDLARAYLRDDPRFLRPYLAYQTSTIAAANICLSKTAATSSGASALPSLTHDDALRLVDRLLSDRGASLNRHFRAPYRRAGDEFARPLTRYLALWESARHFRHLFRIRAVR